MEYTPSKDVVKTVEMVTKDWEYYIHLFDKAAVRCKKIGSNFERSSTVGKKLSNNIACHREIVHERKSQTMQQTSLLS